VPQYITAYSQNLIECGDLLSIMYPTQLGEWVHISSLTSYVFSSPKSIIMLKDKMRKTDEESLSAKGITLLALINANLTIDAVTPIFSKKPIRGLQDLKGMRLRAPGKILEEYIWKPLNVNVLEIPISEVYMAMSRGLCDAAKSGTQRLLALGLHEVCRYVYLDSYVSGFTPSCIVCSSKALAQLPKEMQGKILEAGKRVEEIFWNDAYFNPKKYGMSSEIDALNEAQAKGMEIAFLPSDVFERIQKSAEEGIKDLAQKTGEQGKYFAEQVFQAKNKYPSRESAVYNWLMTIKKSK